MLRDEMQASKSQATSNSSNSYQGPSVLNSCSDLGLGNKDFWLKTGPLHLLICLLCTQKAKANMYFGQIVDCIRYKSTVGLSFTFIPDDLVFRTATIFFLEAKWNRLFIWDHLAKRSSLVLIDKSRLSA